MALLRPVKLGAISSLIRLSNTLCSFIFSFFTTNIGIPKFNWKDIPLKINKSKIDFPEFSLENGIVVNMGNPHIVFFVDNVENFDLKKVGPKIENHELFPNKCNLTLAKIINKNLIKVKVWERGSGLTKACGTAACAVAVAGMINGLVNNKTDIEFELGKLSIFIDNKKSVHMKGTVSDIKNIEIKI